MSSETKSNKRKIVLVKCPKCKRWSVESESAKGCWRHNPLVMIRSIFGIDVKHQEECYFVK